ncbi:MAG TPA: LysM peptidoglycan-binding domain-containing protein [Phototrophicaceae bacterium]|nr:LysM peptidoglycan-binding domain-containing protein [Phototrophicaceae bacterium]
MIKVKPEELRQSADLIDHHTQQIRQRIEALDVEMEAVQQSQKLEGNRAARLLTRYHQSETVLVEWAGRLQQFAELLRQAADVFAQADKSATGVTAPPVAPGNPAPAPAPTTIHTVVKGDTLWAIAQRNGTTVDALMAANPGIKNRNLIYPGQQIVIPGGTGAPVGGNISTPAPVAVENTGRTGAALNSGIDSLNVEQADRYRKLRDNNPQTYDTYCNLFAWDVAQKFNAKLPLWLDEPNGRRWLGATAMKSWLDGNLDTGQPQGPQSGWSKVDHTTAVQAANQGHVVVVAGHGHMAVVRAGNDPAVGKEAVMIAQAGENNFNQGPLKNGWGRYTGEAEFYIY